MKTSSQKAFTLVELICVVAIIAVLAALLAGLYSHVQESGRQTKCLHNLTQIATAVHLFAIDHEGRFPVFKDFDVPLEPYIPDPRIFYCPSAEGKGNRADGRRNDYFLSLAANDWVWDADGHIHAVGKLALVQPNPSSTVMCGDATGSLLALSTSAGMAEGLLRHSSGANYVFMDGHAKLMTPEEQIQP